MDLTDRQKQLLKVIIELYAKNGEPVASETIERNCDLGVSPATIRNEMVKLTESGYLKQPHTSAGRIPTAMGFRIYINELMHERDLPIVDEVSIRQQVMDKRSQFDHVVEEATRALARKCSTLAVCLHDGQIFYAGAASILDFPEFDEIEVARFVLSLFDQPLLLEAIFKKAQGPESLHVIFGEETDYEHLMPTSFAFLNYDTGAHIGVIGIIGPARLNFPHVIPYLRYVGQVLTEAGRY